MFGRWGSDLGRDRGRSSGIIELGVHCWGSSWKDFGNRALLTSLGLGGGVTGVLHGSELAIEQEILDVQEVSERLVKECVEDERLGERE